MITDYDPGCKYQVYEIGDNSQKFKIGEIENWVFYDVDKKGNRIGSGFRFSNTSTFWSQFKKIDVKKTERPLWGYESIAWGAYWTISAFITIILVVAAEGIDNKVFWLISSGIHFWLTIKYRYNKYMVYWMAFASIIVVLIMFNATRHKK